MRDFIQELRHALRMLARNPAFTGVAVLTLALGIAANTAIFSVVDAVLLSPLPYPQADRLVMVWSASPGGQRQPVAPANFLDWREQSDVFEELTSFQALSLNHSGEGTPERLRGASVSTNFFQVMGVAPALGTTFQPSVGSAGPQQVVVLSHELWQRRFGGDARILGRSVRLNERSYEVIGVMPQRFGLPAITPMRAVPTDSPELWVPAAVKDIPQLGPDVVEDRSGWRGASYLRVLGRLKPGVTLERATSAMSTIAERLAREYPETNERTGIALVPLREQIVGNVQPVLWVLLGAVGLVLAIACANVANLSLARASARRQEFAVRVALGAGRGRLVRQLLVESVLLALGAGALGLLLALWGLDGLLVLVPAELPRLGEVHLEGRVLAFTLCVSLGTGVLFGLVPALQAAAPDLNGVLRQAGGGKVTARNRSRSALVVGEVALAVVLLIGAGLLLRSLWRLQSVEPGFQAEHVLTWKVSLPTDKYPDGRRQAAFFEQLLERVASLPGVRSAGGVSDLPLGGADIWTSLSIEGREPPRPGEHPSLGLQVITPGYLRTLGIPLRQGREVTAADTADAQQVVLLNETAARRYLPGMDPVGQRVRLGAEDEPWRTVVGVVGDVRHQGLAEDVRPEVYMPALQRTFFFMSFVARTEGEPVALVSAVRSAVESLDPELPISGVRPMEQVVATAMARPRFVSLLVALFAGLSLLLAGVGLYGVIAYMARQRTREIGIRMALGARPADVLRWVVGQGMLLSLGGVGLGLLGAWAATRVMGSLLFEVSATDPLTFGALALLVAAVTLVATWLPARRATRVDPLVALRGE